MSIELESSIIPDEFREFDRVAWESFGFLVQERGCSEPAVEYWRDYYLAYALPDDVKINVGTERGMGEAGWLGVYPSIAYRGEGHVLFFLDGILEDLGVPVGAGKRPWPDNVKEYAAVVEEHFDRIVDHVRSNGMELAREGPGAGSAESSIVLRGVDGSPLKTVCIGAGVHFWGSQYLPIDRETFWKIADQGYAPSYSACRCPSCGYAGNVGQRQRQSWAVALASRVKWISLLIFLLSMAGCAVIGGWRESDFRVPVTFAAFLAWALSRFVEARLARAGFMAWCPRCGCESKDFDLVGPPPTVADGANPLRPSLF